MPGMRLLAAAIAISLAGTPAPAETVCRPTALGSLRCSGPAARPEPRPPYRSDVQALDRLTAPVDPTESGKRFVPARETNRLGTTLTDEPVSGPCLPDRLGNQRCR
jgi:hypothetical protein